MDTPTGKSNEFADIMEKKKEINIACLEETK